MACYTPLTAYQCVGGAIVFHEHRNEIIRQLQLPCGQCIGCRLERSRQWAMRCMHEAQLHKNNAFVTLTYEDSKLPKHNSLQHADFQKFLKRLRRRIEPLTVRFYMCGEYGETTQRPHYHACLFGWDWPDKVYYSKSPSGEKLFESQLLYDTWQQGDAKTADVTFQSAAYVARYCVQKITGDKAKEHYGERTPEYNKMSLKPGIGRPWLDKYLNDVYPHDYVIVNKHKVRPPRFYDDIYKKHEPDEFEAIQWNRELWAIQRQEDNTPARLHAKQTVQEAQLKQLKRTI